MYLPRPLLGLLAFAVSALSACAAPSQANIPYRDSGDAYALERCRLDVYLPAGRENFPLVVWFHGGNLVAGNRQDARNVAEMLVANGIGCIVPSYRLSPRATYPAYIEDAAAACAWARTHAASLHADPSRVFIGGHSAGAYLSLMLALDERWLKTVQLSPFAFAGYIPVSGQTLTHVTIRDERHLSADTGLADEASPMYHGSAHTPPMLLLWGDHDLPARAEENALLLARLQAAGNRMVEGHLQTARDHGSIINRMEQADDPARQLVLGFILRTPSSREEDPQSKPSPAP
jgi:acetyl esterase/lipase